MSKSKRSGGGGLKGFFTRAGTSFYSGGQLLSKYGMKFGAIGAKLWFVVTTTALGKCLLACLLFLFYL